MLKNIETTIKMNQFKSILLLKVPFCTHTEAAYTDENFRTKAPFRPVPSLALAALCAFIDKYKKINYNIKAVDINIRAYTKPGIPINTTVYTDLMTDCIKNTEYDVLALSVMFVFNIKWAQTAVKLSRRFHPGAKIIIGGGYPTLFPERCLKTSDIDDVIIGEGEATLLHILNRYNNFCDPEFEKKFPIGSYASKDENGKIAIQRQTSHFINPSDLPVPTWSYLNIEKYFKKSGDKTLPIEGSRGCPYRCSYCCTYLSWGRKVRYKPYENLASEVAEIKNNYSVETLRFVDDNLSFSKEWINNFLKKVLSMHLPLKLTASNFSAKHLDEEIINLLVKAGMQKFGIAIESGSPEIQKRINKNLNFDKAREVVQIMHRHNLHIHICWMIGFPGETLEQIEQTFNLARELKANSNQFLTVLPYPGTQLFNEAKSANLLVFDENDLDKFDNRKCDYLKSNEWNYDKLQDMIYDVNIEINFLNNPALDTKEGTDYILSSLENFILRLPEHIVAHIIIGYIYKQKDNIEKYQKHYNSAIKLFENKKLNTTFTKYLSWRHPIIDDFNQFLKAQGIVI